MKKKINILLFFMLICLTLSGCKDENLGDSKSTKRRLANNHTQKLNLKSEFEENYNNYMVVSGEATELMLVYMVGSDLESEAGLASLDIEEMQKSGFSNDNLKVIICTGGANYWWNDEISKDEVAIYEVNSGVESLNKITVLNNDNMAEKDTLLAFLDYVYDNYEANYYSLVLWNHGGGAVLGYGCDEKYDYDSLSLSEMDEAFSMSHLYADGKKFEWIGFDACLMGMIEVAELCEPYANYLIASEEVIPGEGWDYKCLNKLSDGESFSGESAGIAIIDSYADYYGNYLWCNPEYTLSCLDLSKTEDVMNDFNELITVTENDLINGEYSNIARRRGNTKSFGIISEDLCYDCVDLYNLAENMEEAHYNEAKDLQNSLKEMVVYERNNVENAHGVAIYFPYNNKMYAEEWVDEYSLYNFSEPYLRFVKNFTETFNGAPLTAWDLDNDDASVDISSDYNVGSGDDVGNIGSIGNFSVTLTDEQVENFAGASLQIWEIYENMDNGSYGLWINSSEVSLSDDGVLTSNISNKRFILKDTSGHEADCCAFEIERGSDYAVYQTYVKNYTDEESGFYVIEIKVDSDNPNGVITGIYPYDDSEDESNIFPAKKSVTFEQDSEISPFSFGRIIKFNDDGTVAPFDDWERNSGYFYGFYLNGDLYVDMVDIDPEIEKVYVYKITDTQGNTYMVNVIQ